MLLLHNIKTYTAFTKQTKIVLFILLFSFLSNVIDIKSAVSVEDDDEFFSPITISHTQKEYDPWEKFNRRIFNFNLVFYDKVLIPFGVWYNDFFPLWFRWSFKNFVQNYTETPKDVILSVLDFDIEAILVSAWRFAINTVFGFFGMDDVAFLVDLKSYNKSIDNILYFYHIPRGPFIILPLLGPSNLRSTIGSIGYIALTSSIWSYSISSEYASVFSYQSTFNPFYIPFHKNGDIFWISTGMWGGNYINIASDLAGMAAFLSDGAVDKYTNFRTSYYQGVENKEKNYINARMNGKIENKNICDYDGLVELPEDCFEDPKDYDLIEHSNINKN